MSDYIKVCATCDHYPNDKHCIGCEWDKNTGDNTKWENRKYIDRKVIEDIKAEIMNERNDIACGVMAKYSSDEAYYNALGWALNIIDKHCGKEKE